MRFRILGPIEVLSPTGWAPIGAAKWRSLLACLLVCPGEVVSTETLIDELWGDSPPPTANNLVSIYVHRLRKEVLGDAESWRLVYRAHGYLLRVSPGDLDIDEFESLVASGRNALAAADPDRAAALLAEALGLWRGPLLADVQPSARLATHAHRAAELRLAATELRVEADIACGRAPQVVAELRGLVREHPLREGLWVLLIRALSEADRAAEALEAYEQARQAIAEELGADPGSELKRLYAELLAAEAAAGPVRSILRPAQLPTDIRDFTGREAHVAQLCTLLLDGNHESAPGAVPIAAVSGAGGLGKTTLAVHAAHRVRAEFPDGQLYVDLLGASAQPAEPGEVLARFLRDLGIEGNKVPAHDDERAALFRTTLVGRRVLILLDNARDAAQVRPLLPGSSACAVLVTARNRTSDLAGTRFVDLTVLADTEALALFSRIVGEGRAAAEPVATAEVLVACAGLPLAIRICAARLAARRQWRIATLAGRLRSEHRRLDELSIGDLAVRASFQVSYDSLRLSAGGVDPARVFRLLGLWQGSRISLAAAAALLGAQEDQEDAVAAALETLVDANLLESPAPDWYLFHDLLRVYATERAQAEEPEAVREEAVNRLLRWYLDTTEAAANVVSPQRYLVPRQTGTPGYQPLAFASLEEALAWYDGERANLVSATRLAASVGLHDVAWRLPPTLFPVFSRRSNWADCVTTHRIGLESAQRAGNRAGAAWVLNQMGFALARLRDSEAFDCLKQALAIRRELGDTRGEAQTAIALGEGHLKVHGPGAEALRYLRLAVDLLAPMGAISLRSVALNNLGEVYFELGDLDAAEECYVQARDICREMVGGHVEGHVLHNLGRVYHFQQRFADAVASFTEALRKHRAAGLLWGEAVTLKHLGEVRAETGDLGDARSSLAEALRIFEQIGDQVEATETVALQRALFAG
jgi:DNA-binding SARP family transcriptional activator